MGRAMFRRKWKWHSWWGIFGNSCLTAKRMLLCPSLITAFTGMSNFLISCSNVAMLSLSAVVRFLAKSTVEVVWSFRIHRVWLPFSGWTPSNARMMPPFWRILFRWVGFCCLSAFVSAR